VKLRVFGKRHASDGVDRSRRALTAAVPEAVAGPRLGRERPDADLRIEPR